MRYSDLLSTLSAVDSELSSRLSRLPDWMRGTDAPVTIVFCEVVFPYFKQLLKADPSGERLRTLLEFFEQMAVSTDPKVANVLWVEILEPMLLDPDLVKQMWPHLGPNTKAFARDGAEENADIFRIRENLPNG